MGQAAGCTLIDVETPLKDTPFPTSPPAHQLRFAPLVALSMALAAALAPLLPAQTIPMSPPPSDGGVFPVSEVHAGMKATAWTVFKGTAPEPMDVEILGVMRNARGPGQDIILVQLRGAKPEYTGVVAGMSGSPVYIGDKLLGSLSFRIGQFSKDPIAGITPIKQMLEVRDMPIDEGSGIRGQGSGNTEASLQAPGQEQMQAMETPLVMSGFGPEAIRLWQQRMAGTGLDVVSAGGVGGASTPAGTPDGAPDDDPDAISTTTTVVPGSAVSMQLVRGDMEIAATCTVTYVDPKQLLACGHPVLQAGPVSLPMTATEVIATLASPMNAFKIVNTGATIGAFTEDRESAIRGVLGAKAHMIPVRISIHGPSGEKTINVEVLDQPSLTSQAVLVTLFNALIENNQSTEDTSYHLTGTIDLEGYPPSPLDLWAPAGEGANASMLIALLAGDRFSRVYSSNDRRGAVRKINLEVEVVPHRVLVELAGARLISSNIVHAGDTVMVEATLHPWRQPARNVRISVKLPARLGSGNLRMLVSDAGTLDRTLDQPRAAGHGADLETVLAQARQTHPADRIYVTLLVPETQAGISGQTLTSLPLSVANVLEPQRAAQEVSLNGESAVVSAEAPADGVLAGLQILNLRIEPGGGLN